MPIYDEVWEEEDYMFRSYINLRTLPRNHLKQLSLLKFEFVEYKANQLLACHLYDRMWKHCKNQYGLLEDSYVPECMDTKQHFFTCLKLNSAYGWHKKYMPELFLRDQYSRPVPQFEELAVGRI